MPALSGGRLTLIRKALKNRPTKFRAQRRIEVVDSRTPEQKAKEWREFARLTSIRSGTSISSFDPYDYQEKLVAAYERSSCLVVKSRQTGASETTISWLLYRASKDPSFLGVVFSKNQDDTRALARRVRRMITSHPSLSLRTNSLLELEIEGGGRLLFRPATPDSARGLESVSAFVFDEAAFVLTLEDLYSASAPAQAMVGEAARIIMISTPNGMSGLFWQMLSTENGDRDVISYCKSIVAGDIDPFQCWLDSSGWQKIFIHWRAHPVYGSVADFVQQQRKRHKLTEAKAEREYNLSFGSSADAVFDHSLIHSAEIGCYSAPASGATYVAGIDTASSGDDYFVCQVWRLDRGYPASLVALHRDRHRSKSYNLQKTVEMLKLYRPAITTIESNAGGGFVAEDLTAYLPTLAFETLATTSVSKPVLIDRLTVLLERGQIVFPPSSICPLAEEMRNFRRRPNSSGTGYKMEAASGFHDDCVMAAALSLSAWEKIFTDSGFLFDLLR